jgi:hypothetical protein
LFFLFGGFVPHNTVEKRRAYAKMWREKNRAKTRAYHVAWKQHPNHRTSVRNAQERYRKNNPEAARLSAQLYRLRKDGVPESEIALARFAIQHFVGVCGICETPNPKHKKRFTVDHDHETKRFRGIVCGHCNSAMGITGDSPDLLRLMADWIERHRG